MGAVNCKIVTFSLSLDTIKKLEELQSLMHIPNKSRILTLLIEKEYREKTQAKEDWTYDEIMAREG